MNAAEATSAAESTLRAGRNAAPRNPRRETVQPPRPAMFPASRARSQRASAEQKRRQQRGARAEERAGLRRCG